jgi:two-component system invasion response regulator UvrY
MARVLIVDDHELLRRGLKEVLAEAFPEIEFGEAGSSPEAHARLAAADWDLVLLDINLPGRGGLEVLAESRRLRPRTPVLVISAYTEDEFAVRALKLGAAGYLNKNRSSEEVRAAVRKILAGGKYVTPSLAEKLADFVGQEGGAPLHEALSGRELQVLRLVACGHSTKEIATQLALSEKTIGTYRSRVAQKIGASTSVELTRYAIKHGLVS